MDTACVYEHNTVIHELTQGIQMAKQLRANLNSTEETNSLIQKILSSYDKALFVLKSGEMLSPSPSLPESSISRGSTQSREFEFDQPIIGQNVVSKKRKASTSWEDQVRICTDNGSEGNTDDGYSWRKYGQKLILGAKFPRSYYRCTYRKVQNCFATKQVQKTNEDPTVFEIAYKGKHTCNHGAQSAAPPPLTMPENHETKPIHHHQVSSPNPSEMLSNLRANLSVNTCDMGATVPYSSFSFTPTSPFGFLEDYQHLHFPNLDDDELLQGYSPSFISPATSDFTDWSSSPSLDFPVDPEDVFHNFKFNNSHIL